jgi:hypothetical protein
MARCAIAMVLAPALIVSGSAAPDCVVDDGYFILGAVRRVPARPCQA